MKRLLFSVFTVLLLSVGTAWANTVDDAFAAFKRGDYVKSVDLLWYRLAAAQGNAGAQTNLGHMYYKGQGVVQNNAEAIKWYRLAAAKGHAGAQAMLGLMYDLGQGVPKNYVEAAKWFRLAAAQGDENAQSNLGLAYYEGQGVAQNNVRAHMWWNISAASGDARAVKNRDIVAKKMTSQQIAEAQKMAIECQQKNFKGCD